MNGQQRDLPSDVYVFRMTDDTGMFQHAKYAVPDPAKGYTTDDNARALIMAALLFEMAREDRYLDLVSRYLRFLIYAQKGAWFRNFMNYDRHFAEEKGSQDCFGRCLWALGFTVSRSCIPDGIRDAADSLLKQTASGCDELSFLRSKAYAAIGLSYWKDSCADGYMQQFADDICKAYESTAKPDWKWFEDEITYCNAVLPWALLKVYGITREERYLKIGIESLDFLLKNTFENDIFSPIGCKGWFKKGKSAAEFDEQPVEACETMLACLTAHKLTGKNAYFDRARQCFMWYTGQNTLGISLIDPDTGGCMDGLTPNGPNRNEGAESLVSWMIASLVWLDYLGKEGGKNECENI